MKQALRKAGIGYHDVVAGHRTAGELRGLVEKLVRLGVAGSHLTAIEPEPLADRTNR